MQWNGAFFFELIEKLMETERTDFPTGGKAIVEKIKDTKDNHLSKILVIEKL